MHLSDCNEIRTHLVPKQTLNHLAKLTKSLKLQISFQSLKIQILRLFRARSTLTFMQLQSIDSR